MIRRPPRAKRAYTLLSYTTIFRYEDCQWWHSPLRGPGVPRTRCPPQSGPRRCRARSHPPPPSDPRTRTKSRSGRSEEHTSELQSLMRTSYAIFCLQKKIHQIMINKYITKQLKTLNPPTTHTR